MSCRNQLKNSAVMSLTLPVASSSCPHTLLPVLPVSDMSDAQTCRPQLCAVWAAAQGAPAEEFSTLDSTYISSPHFGIQVLHSCRLGTRTLWSAMWPRFLPRCTKRSCLGSGWKSVGFSSRFGKFPAFYFQLGCGTETFCSVPKAILLLNVHWKKTIIFLLQAVGKQHLPTPSLQQGWPTPSQLPAVRATWASVAATARSRATTIRKKAGSGGAAQLTSSMALSSPAALWMPGRLKRPLAGWWTCITMRLAERYRVPYTLCHVHTYLLLHFWSNEGKRNTLRWLRWLLHAKGWTFRLIDLNGAASVLSQVPIDFLAKGF